jgi:hypothetical protein
MSRFYKIRIFVSVEYEAQNCARAGSKHKESVMNVFSKILLHCLATLYLLKQFRGEYTSSTLK